MHLGPDRVGGDAPLRLPHADLVHRVPERRRLPAGPAVDGQEAVRHRPDESRVRIEEGDAELAHAVVVDERDLVPRPPAEVIALIRENADPIPDRPGRFIINPRRTIESLRAKP